MIYKKPKKVPPTDLRKTKMPKSGRKEVTYLVSYRYNGGVSDGGDWYPGYEVPPPLLPEGTHLVGLGVGFQLNSRPPYATALLVKDEQTDKKK